MRNHPRSKISDKDFLRSYANIMRMSPCGPLYVRAKDIFYQHLEDVQIAFLRLSNREVLGILSVRPQDTRTGMSF